MCTNLRFLYYTAVHVTAVHMICCVAAVNLLHMYVGISILIFKLPIL